MYVCMYVLLFIMSSTERSVRMRPRATRKRSRPCLFRSLRSLTSHQQRRPLCQFIAVRNMVAKLLSATSSLVFNTTVGIATVCAVSGVYLLRRFVMENPCPSRAVLRGKTVIITGANTGIGKQTAIDLAKRDARVILACRNAQAGEKTSKEIRKLTDNEQVVFKQLDLASFSSIREFAATVLNEEQRIDVLVNNAGVFMMPLRRSQDGVEMHLAVNYLGHFLLTNLLLERHQVHELLM